MEIKLVLVEFPGFVSDQIDRIQHRVSLLFHKFHLQLNPKLLTVYSTQSPDILGALVWGSLTING